MTSRTLQNLNPHHDPQFASIFRLCWHMGGATWPNDDNGRLPRSPAHIAIDFQARKPAIGPPPTAIAHAVCRFWGCPNLHFGFEHYPLRSAALVSPWSGGPATHDLACEMPTETPSGVELKVGGGGGFWAASGVWQALRLLDKPPRTVTVALLPVFVPQVAVCFSQLARPPPSQNKTKTKKPKACFCHQASGCAQYALWQPWLHTFHTAAATNTTCRQVAASMTY
jgi:hypothetical protein